MKSGIGALSIPYARLVIFVIPELPVAMDCNWPIACVLCFERQKHRVVALLLVVLSQNPPERVMSVGTEAGSRDERWSGQWNRTERQKCSTS
jgi:hypothetical protein